MVIPHNSLKKGKRIKRKTIIRVRSPTHQVAALTKAGSINATLVNSLKPTIGPATSQMLSVNDRIRIVEIPNEASRVSKYIFS